MLKPDVADLKAYLAGQSGGAEYVEWSDADIQAVLDAEAASQARRCRVPADQAEWPADLAEALRRRVAHTLALRGLPLGLAESISDGAIATNRVGGLDAEVARLEGPFRRWVIA